MKLIVRALGIFVPSIALAFLLPGCGRKSAAPAERPPAAVSVLTVETEPVKLTTELPGRINPVREAQVRARATGILLKRLFEEGANVKEGDVLFEIDPEPLQAELNSARAAHARAEAALKESAATVERYRDLVQINAISRQTFDEAQATLGQDEAELLAAKAGVRTAELNLSYAKVTAPISGRIGRAMVTEGALVSAVEATQLAVIRQLDPVYFDFTQSSTDLLRLRRSLEAGSSSSRPAQADVTLILDDGSTYDQTGRVLFSDVSVDPTTGMVTLRALVPNPGYFLLTGMFVRGQIVQRVISDAITVPQRTVTYGAGGGATVLVVTDENKVELRRIDVDRLVGNKVLVARGLKAGEKIIVEGSQKAPPGSVVAPVPFNSNGPTPVAEIPARAAVAAH
ncbi:MAG TPA: efflux RND transporter periplasmic adaptor subunit [Verrucomicrobiae bacterium]|nr:efflux RND transporter periplasmic adaptor subunit [Verrucomicrobiae bacterium]